MSTTASLVVVSLGLLTVLVIATSASASTLEPLERRLVPSAGSTVRPASVGDTLTTRSLPQIENLRLDSAPPEAPQPSAVLKFDVFNATSARLTDVVMKVSFLKKPPTDGPTTPLRVLVGPVTVRVGEILQTGFALSYEMLFRNLSAECDCLPRVEILSARSLPD
jgi:hypothetical protein